MGERERSNERDEERRYRSQIDPEQPYSVAIVEAVADATDTDPAALPEVLYEVVDGDALEQLFDDEAGAKHDLRVSFTFCDRLVTIFPNRTVVVTEEEWA